MRYSYEIYEADEHGWMHRVDTGIRVELVQLKPNQAIRITDNLYPNNKVVEIRIQDDLDGWLEAAARASQWSDKVWPTENAASVSKIPYNPLEETDGFHVKATLSEVKLERTPEDANVKTAAAASKPRVAAVPPIAIMALGAAMQTGADKYGYFNWRSTSVTASVFYNAMLRHLEQWYSGEQHASDTGVHHLAHLMAGAAIILDAEMNNVFKDDRPPGIILGDDYDKYFMRKGR